LFCLLCLQISTALLAAKHNTEIERSAIAARQDVTHARQEAAAKQQELDQARAALDELTDLMQTVSTDA
jgi:hypothetical protein